MKDALNELYNTVMERKQNPAEGSYTCYLFEKGLDKILKKCGEECAETIVAAKNNDNAETVMEITDLMYHLVVLMAQQGISPQDIEAELEKRSQKIGNLKKRTAPTRTHKGSHMADKSKHTGRQRTWFKLDNAAKIFPGQNSSKWSNIFRLSVTLDKKIDPGLLEQALEQTIVRFPCFDVRMRRGFFWYYLEKNKHAAPPVLPDIQNPCHRIRWNENRHFLFRVYYYENRISLDFYHALSDAYGATWFIATLAAQYLRLTGCTIPAGDGILDLNEQSTPAELEDSFARFASSKASPKKRGGYVYHARGTRMPAHTVNITTGYLPVDKLSAEAKKHNATITEFLAALMLDVLYRKQLAEKRRQKEISAQIPVNLRNFFPSKTLRNFSLCYDVRINPNAGEYNFEEILKQVSLYLRYINNPKELNAMMTANLKLETNPFMRAFPLFLKKIGIGISFLLTGERRTSFLLSNLGVVRLPAEMQRFVERCTLMTGPGKINGARIGAVSYQNTMALTFANLYRESDIEREFFTRFVKMGIPVKIESNRD